MDIEELLAAQRLIESASKKKRKCLDSLSGEKKELDSLENTWKQVSLPSVWSAHTHGGRQRKIRTL
jgi:hypothetical protein